MPGDQLDRDDLIRGINAVIAKLRATCIARNEDQCIATRS